MPDWVTLISTLRYGMLHFGKCNQQQVNCIQHKFNTHKNNDGIAAG